MISDSWVNISKHEWLAAEAEAQGAEYFIYHVIK